VSDLSTKMMKRALTLAKRGIGKTSPNPSVGCVIVKDGNIVGEGWHKKAGTPHAEVHALNQAVALAKGSDVYVTLEPCAHFGKTPPCSDALIKAGVSRVVIGTIDPHPKVSGKGVNALKKAGIIIETGVLEQECREINEAFIKHATTGLPFIALKSAMTLDGKTATETGDSKWITGEKSRYLVHKLRRDLDAVMVGVGTVISDDPELTVRHLKGRNPLRIIVDSDLKTPLKSKVIKNNSDNKTILATACIDQSKIDLYKDAGVEVLVCKKSCEMVDLKDMLERMGKQGIQSILLEGGQSLAGNMLKSNLIDKFIFFYGTKLMGGEGKDLFAGAGLEKMSDALSVNIQRVTRSGDDIMVEAYLGEKDVYRVD